MKKIRYITVLIALIFCSCATKKHFNTIIEQNSFGQTGSVYYKITEKYFIEKRKYFLSEKTNKTRIKRSDWNKIAKEIKSLDLTKINLLESRTNERELDGDSYAQIKIEYNNIKYKTPHYDSSNPNYKLKKIDSLINYIRNTYSTINYDEFYDKANKIKKKREEEEFNNTIHPYQIVEIKPVFPGGEIKMIEFIEKQKQSLKNKSIGTSMAYFNISEKGRIYDIKVRADNRTLKENTLKIIESMPNWKAGIYRDSKVKVKHYIKIEY